MLNREMISLPEGVRILQLTKAKMLELWERLKGFDRLYSDATYGDELGFYARLLGENTIILETDGGIMIIDNIIPHQHAQVHVSFWDKKLSARKELLKETLKWVFEVTNVERIEVLIPAFSHALKRFIIDKMGFSFEGILRNRLLYKGQFKDIFMLSILRGEVL